MEQTLRNSSISDKQTTEHLIKKHNIVLTPHYFHRNRHNDLAIKSLIQYGGICTTKIIDQYVNELNMRSRGNSYIYYKVILLLMQHIYKKQNINYLLYLAYKREIAKLDIVMYYADAESLLSTCSAFSRLDLMAIARRI